MNLHILSDLHIDFADFDPPANEAEELAVRKVSCAMGAVPYFSGVAYLFVFCIACLLTPVVYAQPESGQDEFRKVEETATTCFTGPWTNADTYVQSLVSRDPDLGQDAQSEARQRFSDILENYECRWFDYFVNGYKVRGFYSKPKHSEDDLLPAVIYNRGGNADTGVLPTPFIIGKLFPIVKEGFVIVGTMYRGARLDSDPHPDRLADEFGGEDVNDVLALLPIIDDMPFVDDQKLGIWGTSRGGMMAYLAARLSDRFLALVAEGAPTDLESEVRFRPEMEAVLSEWIPEYALRKAAALRERSVVNWADELPRDTSILILHGTADQQVSANSALALAAKFQEIGRPYRLVMFENGGHSLHRSHQDDVTREVSEWFALKLKGKPRFAESINQGPGSKGTRRQVRRIAFPGAAAGGRAARPWIGARGYFATSSNSSSVHYFRRSFDIARNDEPQ